MFFRIKWNFQTSRASYTVSLHRYLKSVRNTAKMSRLKLSSSRRKSPDLFVHIQMMLMKPAVRNSDQTLGIASITKIHIVIIKGYSCKTDWIVPQPQRGYCGGKTSPTSDCRFWQEQCTRIESNLEMPMRIFAH